MARRCGPFFTFVIPVLVVVNVPARLLALPFRVDDPAAWWLPAFAVVATVAQPARRRDTSSPAPCSAIAVPVVTTAQGRRSPRHAAERVAVRGDQDRCSGNARADPARPMTRTPVKFFPCSATMRPKLDWPAKEQLE